MAQHVWVVTEDTGRAFVAVCATLDDADEMVRHDSGRDVFERERIDNGHYVYRLPATLEWPALTYITHYAHVFGG